MQPRFSDERYAVFDDFLARPDFVGVWRFVQAQRYERVHAHGCGSSTTESRWVAR